MNREILFRGKSIFTKHDWMYGSYLNLSDKDYVVPKGQSIMLCNCEIIPETVGQFTGLTDKNGVKIFEGDIIKFKTTRYHTKHQRDKKEARPKWFTSPVLFIEGGFVINESSKIHLNADEYDTSFCCCFNCKKGEDFEPEIIGNIFDNKDILK